MIGSLYRFHGLGSLRRVYQNGKTARTGGISLKYLANPKRKYYRVAVVVSRKVHKSAVRRNRIRRRIYEAVRGRQNEIKEPYDLVFTVFSDELAEQDFNKLQKAVDRLLEDSGVIGT